MQMNGLRYLDFLCKKNPNYSQRVLVSGAGEAIANAMKRHSKNPALVGTALYALKHLEGNSYNIYRYLLHAVSLITLKRF